MMTLNVPESLAALVFAMKEANSGAAKVARNFARASLVNDSNVLFIYYFY